MKTGTIEEREVDKRKDEPQYKEIIVYKKSVKKKRSW